ncbi:MAG: inositol monophosphatase [Betaproteobacteria bacterium]|nr:inositol monophosphatase [Betaproteobacteria bacterium]
MHPMLTIAIKAARRAGGVINRAARNLDVLAVREKATNDFVTEVDKEAEQVIIRTLLEAYPKHSILAEESGALNQQAKSEYQWIIDPLDGTTNFVHGFPQYAVAIALMHRGVITQAVVYDPAKNDLFTATRGGGAFLNDTRIRVSKRLLLKSALVGTGFPFKQHVHIDAYLAMLRDIMQNASAIRRAGSAALDLAYVASGRMDVFWEIGLAPWDIAAGALLITEAGGVISDLQGKDGYMNSGNIVGGNLALHEALVKKIAPYLTPALKNA